MVLDILLVGWAGTGLLDGGCVMICITSVNRHWQEEGKPNYYQTGNVTRGFLCSPSRDTLRPQFHDILAF